MNKQTTSLLVAIVIIIIIIAGAAAYLLYGGGGGEPSPTATPSPTTTVGDASTLTFDADVTSQGTTVTYHWFGKDIHTTPTIRVDLPGYSIVLDTTQEKAWSSTDDGATWTASTDFATDWTAWSQQWFSYVDELTPGHWSGSGDFSYTDPQGQGITLTNIVINPTIPDSTFNVGT
jgi:hypothetical protein